MKNIPGIIKNWYDQHKRRLPWRETSDPYRIWISEIILQQTRVDQGIHYYHRFMETFPDIETLAEAPEQEVLKLWQGLGYYSRARNLHATARRIVQDYKGVFPGSYSELIKLKGIGAYTGAAIASFAFGEPVAAVDGNVARVISRLYGITEPINSSAASKRLRQITDKLVPESAPGEFNQAMIEFGAIQCKPRSPLCSDCPLQEQCFAYNSGQVETLPIKKPAAKQKNRFFNYLNIHSGGSLFLNKRKSGDIWQNLYEFPLIETHKNTSPENVMASEEWEQILQSYNVEIVSVSRQILHQLSHQKIHCRIFTLRIPEKIQPNSYLKQNYFEIPVHQFEAYPVPRLISRLLEQVDQNGLHL